MLSEDGRMSKNFSNNNNPMLTVMFQCETPELAECGATFFDVKGVL